MKKSIYSAKQLKLQVLLRQVRVDAGLLQADLAKKLKKPQSFVSKYESGERRLDLIELEQVCAAVGITLSNFIAHFENTTK